MSPEELIQVALKNELLLDSVAVRKKQIIVHDQVPTSLRSPITYIN